MTAFQPSLDLGLAGEPQVMATEPDAVTIDGPPRVTAEPRGAVYTRRWVVDLILDLVGYRPGEDLAGLHAVEPSAGDGAFLVPMTERLLASLRIHGRELSDARE